jgi:anti-sigma regulatory factor (Ser/Thr protein kinase)
LTGSSRAWREITLPEGLEAPARARRWLLDGIADAPGELADTAVLLVSELVTNAVLYGRPAVTMRMRTVDGVLEVIVADRGETGPVAPGATRPDPRRPGGRGLFIVAELSSEWGVDPLRPGPGKAVWFRLRPPP